MKYPRHATETKKKEVADIKFGGGKQYSIHMLKDDANLVDNQRKLKKLNMFDKIDKRLIKLENDTGAFKQAGTKVGPDQLGWTQIIETITLIRK